MARENFGKPRRIGHAHSFAGALVVPDAATRLDQDAVAVCFHHKAIEARFNAVPFVAGLVFRPKCFRDHAEHAAAIPPVGAGAHGSDAEITEVQPGQKDFQPWTSFLPRSKRSLASSTIFLPRS